VHKPVDKVGKDLSTGFASYPQPIDNPVGIFIHRVFHISTAY